MLIFSSSPLHSKIHLGAFFYPFCQSIRLSESLLKNIKTAPLKKAKYICLSDKLRYGRVSYLVPHQMRCLSVHCTRFRDTRLATNKRVLDEMCSSRAGQPRGLPGLGKREAHSLSPQEEEVPLSSPALPLTSSPSLPLHFWF